MMLNAMVPVLTLMNRPHMIDSYYSLDGRIETNHGPVREASRAALLPGYRSAQHGSHRARQDPEMGLSRVQLHSVEEHREAMERERSDSTDCPGEAALRMAILAKLAEKGI